MKPQNNTPAAAENETDLAENQTSTEIVEQVEAPTAPAEETTNESQETTAPVEQIEETTEEVKEVKPPPQMPTAPAEPTTNKSQETTEVKKSKLKVAHVSKAKKRISWTTNLSEEQDEYLKPIVADLIKFKVCETQSDFVAKAIDFYVNYQAVCNEKGLTPTLSYPIPDGLDGSIDIQHRLLQQSLFISVSNMPTV